MNVRNKTKILSKEEGPFEARIRALLDQMTLEEKLSQITESWGIGGVERLGIPPLYKGGVRPRLRLWNWLHRLPAGHCDGRGL